MSTSVNNIRQTLERIDETFHAAIRIGTSIDDPEGSRYITLSETLVQELTEDIHNALFTLDKLVREMPASR